jgi:hypothetical protein
LPEADLFSKDRVIIMKKKTEIIQQLTNLSYAVKKNDVDSKYADGYKCALEWVIDME